MTIETIKPNLHNLSLVVGWSYAYADPIPLNQEHPAWPQFFELSEWLRRAIIKQLGLQEKTTWEDIYRISGFLVSGEYPNEEEFWKAYEFGNFTVLEDAKAPEKFRELEELKYSQIVHRI